MDNFGLTSSCGEHADSARAEDAGHYGPRPRSQSDYVRGVTQVCGPGGNVDSNDCWDNRYGYHPVRHVFKRDTSGNNTRFRHDRLGRQVPRQLRRDGRVLFRQRQQLPPVFDHGQHQQRLLSSAHHPRVHARGRRATSSNDVLGTTSARATTTAWPKSSSALRPQAARVHVGVQRRLQHQRLLRQSTRQTARKACQLAGRRQSVRYRSRPNAMTMGFAAEINNQYTGRSSPSEAYSDGGGALTDDQVVACRRRRRALPAASGGATDGASALQLLHVGRNIADVD